MPEPENPAPKNRVGRPPGAMRAVSEYNKRSTNMPIDGPYRKLAEEVRRILGWTEELNSGVSTRMAGIKSGINHNSVAHLVRGIRMERFTLERFGKEMAKVYPDRNVDVDKLLALAGYVPEAWQDKVANQGLCQFKDITIRMHVKAGEAQYAPRFFAYHGEDVAVYTIDTVEQIAGDLPQQEQQFVEVWAKLRKKELQHNWQLLQKGELQEPIAPLA